MNVHTLEPRYHNMNVALIRHGLILHEKKSGNSINSILDPKGN